jgi:hypothetical protein
MDFQWQGPSGPFLDNDPVVLALAHGFNRGTRCACVLTETVSTVLGRFNGRSSDEKKFLGKEVGDRFKENLKRL